ncbi:hypothetical protein J2741_001915 [Methanolinea mesophila]|nr:hypothetical protein [Methanolinea mesophila]
MPPERGEEAEKYLREMAAIPRGSGEHIPEALRKVQER